MEERAKQFYDAIIEDSKFFVDKQKEKHTDFDPENMEAPLQLNERSDGT